MPNPAPRASAGGDGVASGLGGQRPPSSSAAAFSGAPVAGTAALAEGAPPSDGGRGRAPRGGGELVGRPRGQPGRRGTRPPTRPAGRRGRRLRDGRRGSERFERRAAPRELALSRGTRGRSLGGSRASARARADASSASGIWARSVPGEVGGGPRPRASSGDVPGNGPGDALGGGGGGARSAALVSIGGGGRGDVSTRSEDHESFFVGRRFGGPPGTAAIDKRGATPGTAVILCEGLVAGTAPRSISNLPATQKPGRAGRADEHHLAARARGGVERSRTRAALDGGGRRPSRRGGDVDDRPRRRDARGRGRGRGGLARSNRRV